MTVQARIRKSSSPAATNAEIRFSSWSRSSNGLSIGFQRNDGVLPRSEIRLRIDCHVSIAVLKDVVVMEVAVHDPARGFAHLREQVPCERDNLAALVGCTVEPATNLGDDRPKRGLRRAPESRCEPDRNRGSLDFGERCEIRSGHGANRERLEIHVLVRSSLQAQQRSGILQQRLEASVVPAAQVLGIREQRRGAQPFEIRRQRRDDCATCRTVGNQRSE